jgi:plasmid stability protein
MVMVQLGVPLDEAMALLRAHAFAHDRTLESIARDIVDRKMSLEADQG